MAVGIVFNMCISSIWTLILAFYVCHTHIVKLLKCSGAYSKVHPEARSFATREASRYVVERSEKKHVAGFSYT